jgi:hypothetical protein
VFFVFFCICFTCVEVPRFFRLEPEQNRRNQNRNVSVLAMKKN